MRLQSAPVQAEGHGSIKPTKNRAHITGHLHTKRNTKLYSFRQFWSQIDVTTKGCEPVSRLFFMQAPPLLLAVLRLAETLMLMFVFIAEDLLTFPQENQPVSLFVSLILFNQF